MITIEKTKAKKTKKTSQEECLVCKDKDQLLNVSEMDFGFKKPESFKVCCGCIKRTIHKLFKNVQNVPDSKELLEIYLDENANINTLVVDAFKKGVKVRNISAHGVLNTLDSRIYGHSDYKRSLSQSLARHISNEFKHNLLVIGPTGVGKTHAMEVISKAYDVPVCIVNSALLTPAGYKGSSSIDEIGKAILLAAGGDIQRAQEGIIFLDEFDKAMKSPFASDIANQLLKLMERDYLRVGEQIISTENILFIMSGTFRDLYDRKCIGLSAGKKKEPCDLIKGLKECYGLSDELIGRLSGGIVELDRFDRDDFEKMLREQPRVALSDIYKFLGKYNATLEISDTFIKYASVKAEELGLGVRGLKNIVQAEMGEILFDPTIAENSKVVLKCA